MLELMLLISPRSLANASSSAYTKFTTLLIFSTSCQTAFVLFASWKAFHFASTSCHMVELAAFLFGRLPSFLLHLVVVLLPCANGSAKRIFSLPSTTSDVASWTVGCDVVTGSSCRVLLFVNLFLVATFILVHATSVQGISSRLPRKSAHSYCFSFMNCLCLLT